MNEYLTFRKMITPIFIQVIFWLGVLGCVITGLGTMSQSALMGLATLILGPLVVRIYCELIIVVFKMNEALQRMAPADTADTQTSPTM